MKIFTVNESCSQEEDNVDVRCPELYFDINVHYEFTNLMHASVKNGLPDL